MLQRRTTSLLLTLLLGVTNLLAQPSAQEVEAVIQAAGITGLAAAVVTDGRTTWLEAFGIRSAATRPTVDTTTVFEAASLTKPVVAHAVLQMVDEGLIDLDRPLSAYVNYPDLAHSARRELVTARMILSHTSGLPNWRGGSNLDFINAPGQTFGYSGEGFVYLQRAVEAIEKRPLHTSVRDRVLVPFGMRSSSLVWEERFGPVVAVGHSDGGIALDKFTPTEANAAYTLHTTAADYARFLAKALNGTGLSSVTAAEMFTPQADAGDGISWGLGWGIENTDRGTAVWHWGDNRGFKSFVAGYPGLGRGFVFIANSDNGMLALHRLVELLDETRHPAVDWLNYERFDDASYQVGLQLRKALDDADSPPIRQVYRDLKERFDRDAFTEDTLNDLGYRLLRSGQTDHAIAVFELNVSEYPQASNAYDSLGEAYMISGDLAKALLNYRVSVDLDPGNDNGRAMIARLEAQLRAQNR